MEALASTVARGMGSFVPVGPRVRLDDGEAVKGKSAEEMTADETRWRDSQPVIERCALCADENGTALVIFDGPAGEARAAALEHRQVKHPETLKRRRRRSTDTIGTMKVKAPSELRDLERAEAMRNVEQRRADMGRHEKAPAVEPQEAAGDRCGITAGAGKKRRWGSDEILRALQAFHANHGRPPKQLDADGSKELPAAATVARMFGSWADGMEAAGFDRPRRGAAARTLKTPAPAVTGGAADLPPSAAAPTPEINPQALRDLAEQLLRTAAQLEAA